MTTILYPEYKNAGKIIAEKEKEFYTDVELAEMLKTDVHTNDFKFRVMHLKEYLLDTYGIDLIRASDEHMNKGQKIATCSESLRITVTRLTRRVKNAATKQYTVLSTIDRSQLDTDEAVTYDRSTIKNGLLLSFLNKTKRRVLPVNSTLRIDVPKVIE